jgi:hypothetical protein
MTTALDTDYVRFELDGNLLIATYKKGKKINLEAAHQIVKDRLDFTQSRPVLTLLCNQGVISFDKDARSFLTSPESSKGVKAAAILSDSSATAIIGNFIIKVNRPEIPVRLFTSKEKAIEWLRSKSNLLIP